MNPILLLGTLYGLTGLGFAAFAAHGLADDAAKAAATAAQAQQVQSLFLVAIGLSHYGQLPDGLNKALKISAWLVIAGVLMFAGPIYLKHIWGHAALGAIVPIGGMTIMAGWLVAAFGALLFANRQKKAGSR